MKKQISFVIIGLMIVSGLILALPLSSFRKSLQAFDSGSKLLTIVDFRMNNTRNMAVAQVIAQHLFHVESSIDITVEGASRNNGQLSMNNGSTAVNSVEVSANSRQTQQTDAASYVIDGKPVLQNRSQLGGQSVVNGADVNRISYQTNMTSRTSVNNSKSRLMAMSGSFNSETAAAQGSVKQMAGGAPPPSEAEIIPPIGTLPIGDGCVFMLMLASIIAIIKNRKLAI
jgi:hypothetical protein